MVGWRFDGPTRTREGIGDGLRGALKRLLKTIAKLVPGNEVRVALFRACGYQIGQDVYIAEDMIVAEILEDPSEKLIIGDRVAIAPRVTFITSSDPNRSRLAPDLVKPVRGRIVVRDDAWIGAGAIILPNVTVGEGAVVGAGAVVTTDVPPYSVVVGVPAKVIKRLTKRDFLEEAGSRAGIDRKPNPKLPEASDIGGAR